MIQESYSAYVPFKVPHLQNGKYNFSSTHHFLKDSQNVKTPYTIHWKSRSEREIKCHSATGQMKKSAVI